MRRSGRRWRGRTRRRSRGRRRWRRGTRRRSSRWGRRRGMRRSCGWRGWTCGRRRALWRRLGFSVGAQFFLGSLRHDERRGLRIRCESCELRHGQSGRSKQHNAKFCHDVLDPRKKSWRQGVAAGSGCRRTFRRVDQRLIIRLDCGGRQNANAIYFDGIMGCMRNCSLRIQTMLSNRAFTLSPVASLRRWYGDSASPTNRKCRHRLQVKAWLDRLVRAPAVRRASCPAAPAAAAVRRVHASVAAPPAGDCRADPPAGVQSGGPVSRAGFPAVRLASTARPCDRRPCVAPLVPER
jgi:hypothetical protein